MLFWLYTFENLCIGSDLFVPIQESLFLLISLIPFPLFPWIKMSPLIYNNSFIFFISSCSLFFSDSHVHYLSWLHISPSWYIPSASDWCTWWICNTMGECIFHLVKRCNYVVACCTRESNACAPTTQHSSIFLEGHPDFSWVLSDALRWSYLALQHTLSILVVCNKDDTHKVTFPGRISFFILVFLDVIWDKLFVWQNIGN